MDTQKLAFDITATFETGNNPAAINTYDNGIVSATRHQFTLASGNLWKFVSVMDEYRYQTTGKYSKAGSWRDPMRIGAAYNETLRHNAGFLDALKQDCVSLDGQIIADLMAYGLFYQPVMTFTCDPRGFIYPLSRAFAYDTAIQHGKGHSFFYDAETALKIEHKSKLEGNQERDLLIKAVELRAENLNALAMTRNLPGLRDRANFWQNQVHMENWKLQGKLTLKPGYSVQGMA